MGFQQAIEVVGVVDASTTDEQIWRQAEKYCHGLGINQVHLVASLLDGRRRIAALEQKVAGLEKGMPPHLAQVERR
jgi:phage I-like protein